MAQITLNSNGVASSGSLTLQSNGTTTAVTIDTSQNLGLGVTPSAWSGNKAIQVNARTSLYSSADNGAVVGNNLYYNGTNNIYIASSYATAYQQNAAGQHIWYNAPSGTAGNAISFTTAMTLDASGNLGIGTNSPTEKLQVAGSIRVTSNAANFNVLGGQLDFNVDSTRIGAYNSSGSNILFYTNSSGNNVSERARIDSSGTLLVNTTTTPSSTQSGFYVNSSGLLMGVPSPNVNAAWYKPSAASQADYHRFVVGGSQYGAISWNGTTGTLYTTTSDYRLKENVQPMQNALAMVSQLNPVTYTWKEDGSEGQGFIAHELQAVCPDAVSGSKDAIDTDGNPQYQGIDTSFLVATLTAAIQEQQATIQSLTARIEALEKK